MATLLFLTNDSTLPVNFTTLCQCLAPFNNSLQILCLGGREEGGKGNLSKKKRGKHTRLEKGTRTTSDFHSAEPTAEPVRQRGQSTEAGKSQAQGGGCGSASHPYSAEAGDTFHHLLSEK